MLEKQRQGARVPTKIIVSDFKCGYYDTTIDRVTTFTAVAYNDNGSTKGIPVTIVPISPSIFDLNIIYNPNQIKIKSEENTIANLKYTISNVNNNEIIIEAGETSGIIDISNLKSGLYVLSILDDDSNKMKEFKFKK